MTENYSQTIDVSISSKAHAFQWIGIISILICLGFLMATIFFKWWFVFLFIVFLIFGVIFIHTYNETPKEYTYDINPTRFVIYKKNVINKSSRCLSLLFDDVIKFELFNDILTEDYLVKCNNASNENVYVIVFHVQDKEVKLLIEPDKYMQELIRKNLNDRK